MGVKMKKINQLIAKFDNYNNDYDAHQESIPTKQDGIKLNDEVIRWNESKRIIIKAAQGSGIKQYINKRLNVKIVKIA
jgi:hypothetical protein